jgi:hypothetical protein
MVRASRPPTVMVVHVVAALTAYAGFGRPTDALGMHGNSRMPLAHPDQSNFFHHLSGIIQTIGFSASKNRDMAQFESVRPTCNACQVQMWISRVRPAPTNPLTCELYTFECAVCGATEAMTLDRSIKIEAIDADERPIAAPYSNRARGAHPRSSSR